MERRRGGEQTNKGKTKNARKESFSVSRSRGSRVFLTRVTRPLSTFQIRNTLGAQGFPISPSFIARVSGYHHYYAIRRETQRGRGCNPATETARLRALETFHADASSALENRTNTRWEKWKLETRRLFFRLFCPIDDWNVDDIRRSCRIRIDLWSWYISFI